MNYLEFKNYAMKVPIIFSRDVLLHSNNKQAIRNQLTRWSSRGLLIKLRRGIYILNEADRKIPVSKAYIANQLYGPSYISLEYVLGHYGLIPERVYDVTSVTTKKTMSIQNSLADFAYSHLKPKAYRGFEVFKDESGFSYLMATPEKAILDFIYFNMKKFRQPYRKVFEISYRFQNIDILKPERLKMLVELFDNRKMREISQTLLIWVEQENIK